ncbi:Fibrillarin-like rRNA/tRNA 2'-O-methyltransferase [Labeo rohita]|uniref:Fibrillarin-like rRNA/tRNA 2'-O-methyltransferase n=1 Tax=Labeo rohita TaxID=84645 RepID=A0ABQ8L5F0_LABRO|nr:Fibrillarin-like rRNA/tRNA 2'-O-methyltransferase [Labeo rohita]
MNRDGPLLLYYLTDPSPNFQRPGLWICLKLNWMTIETILPILESLKSATTALCSKGYVSVSMVFPASLPSSRQFKQSCQVQRDSCSITGEKDRYRGYRKVWTCSTACFCTGPASIKHLRFLQADMQQAVRDNMASLYQSLPTNDENRATVYEDSTSIPKYKMCLSAFFGDDYGESMNEDELELYCKEPSIPLNQWFLNRSWKHPCPAHFVCLPDQTHSIHVVQFLLTS